MNTNLCEIYNILLKDESKKLKISVMFVNYHKKNLIKLVLWPFTLYQIIIRKIMIIIRFISNCNFFDQTIPLQRLDYFFYPILPLTNQKENYVGVEKVKYLEENFFSQCYASRNTFSPFTLCYATCEDDEWTTHTLSYFIGQPTPK